MRIVICDDNELFTNNLNRKIKEIVGKSNFKEEPLIYDYIYPPKDLIKYAKTNPIDILFLDINMPGKNGLEIADFFVDYYSDTKIIFITSFDEYVYKAFKYQPFRFIKKDNLDDDLYEALISAYTDILTGNDMLIIKNPDFVKAVKIPRILYVEKENHTNYVNIITFSGMYKYRSNIAELEEKFANYDFIKINASILVNMRFVVSIENNELLLSNNKSFFITRTYLSVVVKKYIDFLRKVR